MKEIKKIVRVLNVLLMLAVFFIATTGFSFYSHTCDKHKVQSVVLSTSDCCSSVVEKVQPEAKSCCSSKIPEQASNNKCGTNLGESSCCSTDLEYFRLTENYSEPSNENRSDLSAPLIATVVSDEPAIELTSCKNTLPNKVKKKPKTPIYRLYQQVKIDPPLI